MTGVAPVDWGSWTPSIRTVLLYVISDGRVLLIRKRNGLGVGRINGPGGKIEPGETAFDAAIRETQEELRVTPTGVSAVGWIGFHDLDGPAIDCQVFTATGCVGEPTETHEATPLWCPVDAVPYDEMWDDDRHWFPHVLAGRPFRCRCVFDASGMLDVVVDVD